MRWFSFFIFFLINGYAIGQALSDTLIAVYTHSILFESDSFNIGEDDQIFINEIVDVLEKNKGSHLTIAGHTDADGSDQYNMKLSKKRCWSVYQYLLSNSIDSTRIDYNYFGEKAPVMSNRTHQGKAKNRRVEIEILIPVKLWTITGRVTSGKMADPIEGGIVMLHSKHYRDTSKTGEDGSFQLLSPYDEVIGIDVLAKNHLMKTTMLKSLPKFTNQLEIVLEKAEPGKSVDLNRFFFVGDRAIILDKFVPELDNLETFLKISPEVCIEIVGHVNEPGRPPVDSTSFEYNLSVARSKLIYDIMVERGIEEERMMYTGKGNWFMLYPEAKTSEEMRKNRRVEIKVRKCTFVQIQQNDKLDLKFDFYSKPVNNR